MVTTETENKLWPDEPPGSYADFTFPTEQYFHVSQFGLQLFPRLSKSVVCSCINWQVIGEVVSSHSPPPPSLN